MDTGPVPLGRSALSISLVWRLFIFISSDVPQLYMHTACNAMCVYYGESKLQVMKNIILYLNMSLGIIVIFIDSMMLQTK